MSEEEDQHEEPLESIEGYFKDLGSAVVVPPTWVITDFIPVGLTFLAAPPKSGKSTLTLAAASLVSGYACKTLPIFLSAVPKVGPAMVFSAEAEAGELRHMVEHGLGVRLEANEGILIADDPWQYRLDDPDGLRIMMRWLKARRPKLVIVDPLIDFHKTDENDSGAMNRLLRPIRQWAIGNDAAFVIVHHTKKPSESLQRYTESDMRGTSALFGIADGLLIATPVPKRTNCLSIKAKFKRARGWERVLQLSAYEDLERPACEVLSDVDKNIHAAVHRGCVSAEDIVKEVQTDLPSIRESLLKLKRNGMVKAIDGKWRV